MKKKEELILLYHFSDCKKEEIISVLQAMKIKYREIPEEKFQQRVGYLVGLPSFKETVSEEQVEPLDQEVMVMYGLSSKRIDQLLLKLEAENVERITLKAVVTPMNQFWSFARLCQAIQKENEFMLQK